MAKTRCEICDRNFKNEEALDMHNRTKHSTKTREKSNSGDISVSKKKARNWIIGLVVIVVLVVLTVVLFSGNSSGGKYDAFAQCLTDSGVTMYGAYWCHNCEAQKDMFGKSWNKVNYIECSLPNNAGQTQECIAEGIQGYPTWEFADGSRSMGTLPLEQLSQTTGCGLQNPTP